MLKIEGNKMHIQAYVISMLVLKLIILIIGK